LYFIALFLIANYSICIRRNQKQLTRAFEPTNHRNLSAINRRAYNFIPCSARVSLVFSTDSTIRNSRFNIGKNQVILGHFFKEMRDCKLIITAPNFLSDPLNDRQVALSAPQPHPLTDASFSYNLTIKKQILTDKKARGHWTHGLKLTTQNSKLRTEFVGAGW